MTLFVTNKMTVILDHLKTEFFKILAKNKKKNSNIQKSIAD